MLETVKNLLKKWQVQVLLVGGAVVVATTFGQCTFEPAASVDEAVEAGATTTVEGAVHTTETTTTESAANTTEEVGAEDNTENTVVGETTVE